MLIRKLLAAGVNVRAHDPVAVSSAKRELGAVAGIERLVFSDGEYEAVQGADALVLVTEWKQYRQPDFERIKMALRTPLIIDGRNQYQPDHVRRMGIIYTGIGRSW